MKKEEIKSLAKECLIDKKIENRRLYIIILIILAMWFVTGCFLVYVLSNTETITTEEIITEDVDMESDSGNNNYIKGDNNGEIKNN